jgi:hypothetical protein
MRTYNKRELGSSPLECSENSNGIEGMTILHTLSKEEIDQRDNTNGAGDRKRTHRANLYCHHVALYSGRAGSLLPSVSLQNIKQYTQT